MKCTAILLLITIFALGDATPVLSGKDTGKITNHDDKDIVLNSGQYAFVVNLIIEKRKTLENPKRIAITTSMCGGIILRPNAVLTAAHCVNSNGLQMSITAWAGVVDIEKQAGEGQKIPVKYYRRHEKYVEGFYYGIYHPNDIAILWLERPFKFDGKYIKQAELPESNFKVVNKRGWIVGWGLTECGEKSSMLKKAVLRAMSQQDCESHYTPSIITDRVICIMSDKGESVNSKGDSGGPFIVQGKVVGVSSFAGALEVKNTKGEVVKSCDPKTPGVYTDIRKYLDWIDYELEEGPTPQIKKTKPKKRN